MIWCCLSLNGSPSPLSVFASHGPHSESKYAHKGLRFEGCLAGPKPLDVLGGQAIGIRFIAISDTMVHDFLNGGKSCREWQGRIHMIGLFARVFAA